jgi:DNA sulfur modification protein DndB
LNKKIKNNSFNDPNHFSFSAVRGVQAGREYYVAMCKLKLISKIFLFNEEELPPEMRSQRILNKARVPELSKYISLNPMDYVFSSITASIDGDTQFTPVMEEGHLSSVGTLKVSMDSRFLINDGQHRRAAIEEAIKHSSELGLDSISVVFYLDRGLKRSQQMFSDLNKHAIKPSTSLNILYNHRDEFSRELMQAIKEIPIFKNNLTELEKTSISNRAHKVFTLNSIYNATKELLGKTSKKPSMSEDEKKLVIQYWNSIYENTSEWNDVVKEEVIPSDLREKYINVYGIALHALGRVGKDLIKNYPKTWQNKLINLKKIDWQRSNSSDWEGRAIINGRLSKSRNSIILTSNLLKKTLGLKLNKTEEKLENEFQKLRK